MLIFFFIFDWPREEVEGRGASVEELQPIMREVNKFISYNNKMFYVKVIGDNKMVISEI